MKKISHKSPPAPRPASGLRTSGLRISALVLAAVTAVALMFAPLPSHAQDVNDDGGDDQGWSQFTRDNTLRGTVTADASTGKGSGSFEIKIDSGEQWRVLYGPNTRFLKERQPGSAADIHSGDMLFAAGNLDRKKKSIGAAVLVGISGEEVRKAKEGLGRTWSAGKVTAIAGTRITVQRLDGVPQTIGVDENTSFRQRKDSITLADVKVGEGVRADGHLESGLFVASILHVFNLNGHEPWLDAGNR